MKEISDLTEVSSDVWLNKWIIMIIFIGVTLKNIEQDFSNRSGLSLLDSEVSACG